MQGQSAYFDLQAGPSLLRLRSRSQSIHDRRWGVGQECPIGRVGSEESTSISGAVANIGYSLKAAQGLSSAGMMLMEQECLRDRVAADDVIAEPAGGVLLDALP